MKVNFSTTTKKLQNVNESARKLEVLKKSDSEIEARQWAIDHTQSNSHPGVIFDTSLQNTLSFMKSTNNFLR